MPNTSPTPHPEASRLLERGFKLCRLKRLLKEPVGNGWNLNPIKAIDPKAGGYGIMLAANGLGSIDPDNVEPAREGLARCGFDLEALMSAGVRTTSTRPGSGGRSAFRVPEGLGRVVFASKQHGTILELRAGQANLQDCLPGTVYRSKDGSGPFTQAYASSLTFDQAPELPPQFLAWWKRMDDDLEFKREQQALFGGGDAVLAVSGKGGKLAYPSAYRMEFNAAHDVASILEEHGYTRHDNGRWAPSTATGAPCVRSIPGREGLWQSDHASDPLNGTFDAWTANVVLNFGEDVEAAEAAWAPTHASRQLEGLEDVPLHVNAPPPLPSFKRSENGTIKATKENIVMALERPDVCGYQWRFDEFLHVVLVAESGTDWRALRDIDYMAVALRLERGGFQGISKEVLRDAIDYVAEMARFDSAKHWLQGLEWDGISRVDSMLQTYFGAAASDYTKAIGRYLMTGLAGRVLQPGIQADMVPVAVGAQGMRKSSAVAALVPSEEFFVALDLSARDADVARSLRGKLVVELGELRGLGARDSEHVKATITRRFEEWRPAYKEHMARYARRCLFIGTSNKADFLSDETGSRRWLPFESGLCDPSSLERDREQLWAEGRALFKRRGVLHQDAERLAAAEHADYQSRDEWESAVTGWLYRPDGFSGGTPSGEEYLTGREVLLGAIGLPDAAQTPQVQARMKRVLMTLGYTYGNYRVGGVKTRCFMAPDLFE